MTISRIFTPPRGQPRFDAIPFTHQTEYLFGSVHAAAGLFPGLHDSHIKVLQSAIDVARRCVMSNSGLITTARALAVSDDTTLGDSGSNLETPALLEYPEPHPGLIELVSQWFAGNNVQFVLDTEDNETVDGYVRPSEPKVIHLHASLVYAAEAAYQLAEQRPLLRGAFLAHIFHLAVVIAHEYHYALKYQLPDIFLPALPLSRPAAQEPSNVAHSAPGSGKRGEGGSVFENAYFGGLVNRVLGAEPYRLYPRQIMRLVCWCPTQHSGWRFDIDRDHIRAIVEGWERLLPFKPDDEHPTYPGRAAGQVSRGPVDLEHVEEIVMIPVQCGMGIVDE